MFNISFIFFTALRKLYTFLIRLKIDDEFSSAFVRNEIFQKIQLIPLSDFVAKYRISRNKCPPRNKRPPKTVIFQRGEYIKPMGFDG